jgi:hypothetical protein
MLPNLPHKQRQHLVGFSETEILIVDDSGEVTKWKYNKLKEYQLQGSVLRLDFGVYSDREYRLQSEAPNDMLAELQTGIRAVIMGSL